MADFLQRLSYPGAEILDALLEVYPLQVGHISNAEWGALIARMGLAEPQAIIRLVMRNGYHAQPAEVADILQAARPDLSQGALAIELHKAGFQGRKALAAVEYLSFPPRLDDSIRPVLRALGIEILEAVGLLARMGFSPEERTRELERQGYPADEIMRAMRMELSAVVKTLLNLGYPVKQLAPIVWQLESKSHVSTVRHLARAGVTDLRTIVEAVVDRTWLSKLPCTVNYLSRELQAEGITLQTWSAQAWVDLLVGQPGVSLYNLASSLNCKEFTRLQQFEALHSVAERWLPEFEAQVVRESRGEIAFIGQFFRENAETLTAGLVIGVMRVTGASALEMAGVLRDSGEGNYERAATKLTFAGYEPNEIYVAIEARYFDKKVLTTIWALVQAPLRYLTGHWAAALKFAVKVLDVFVMPDLIAGDLW